MKHSLLLFLLIGGLFPNSILAQQHEQQISFAQETRPHSYYVEQAKLWALELQKDSLSETSWYNYFRSCRNAHGTADWRSDFVDESPYLMEGGEVVKQMKEYIPKTFTYFYLSYLTQGIGLDNYENLLKAYELNPDFPGIQSSMISYAESSLNFELRKETNVAWYKKNYLSYQLLAYGYNVLMSLDSNSILFTQHDNDTYPIWMLQDALDIRTDIMVINIDFLLLDEYRTYVFQKLNIPQLDLGEIDLDEYHENWEKSVLQIVKNYNGDQSLYVGMTLFNHLYEDFKEQLFISGLAFKYSRNKLDVAQLNRSLYENTFLLDYLEYNFTVDRNQMNVNYQNANYVSCFKTVFDLYNSEKNREAASTIKALALSIAEQVNNPKFTQRIEQAFQ